MTKAYNNLWVEYFHGDPHRCRLIRHLRAYCDTLRRVIEAPIGFINDLESVPIVKGTNNESGVWHDYYSCYDSDPVVDKIACAKIYLEFQRYYDQLERHQGTLNIIKDLPNRAWDFIRRWVKTSMVVVAPFYFHRRSVMATYEEITGYPEPMADPPELVAP